MTSVTSECSDIQSASKTVLTLCGSTKTSTVWRQGTNSLKLQADIRYVTVLI